MKIHFNNYLIIITFSSFKWLSWFCCLFYIYWSRFLIFSISILTFSSSCSYETERTGYPLTLFSSICRFYSFLFQFNFLHLSWEIVASFYQSHYFCFMNTFSWKIWHFSLWMPFITANIFFYLYPYTSFEKQNKKNSIS